MFTLPQIQAAHSEVKTGADFPRYVQALLELGVVRYRTAVSDGHTQYSGDHDYSLLLPAKYAAQPVSESGNVDELKHALSVHQQGRTDYFTFCRQAAARGVEQWTVDLRAMTCTYYDKAGREMVVEAIPAR
jgi:uncharacterized protein YbcV (DUF1398 family)